MIRLELIGNLGRDATVNSVNGKNVINFSVAHTEKWKDSAGAQREKTTWVDCAMWRDSTAVAQYLKKGTQVFVAGTPEARIYQRSDGTSAASLNVRVNTLQLLGGGSGQPNSTPAAATNETQLSNLNSNEDESGLPF